MLCRGRRTWHTKLFHKRDLPFARFQIKFFLWGMASLDMFMRGKFMALLCVNKFFWVKVNSEKLSNWCCIVLCSIVPCRKYLRVCFTILDYKYFFSKEYWCNIKFLSGFLLFYKKMNKIDNYFCKAGFYVLKLWVE